MLSNHRKRQIAAPLMSVAIGVYVVSWFAPAMRGSGDPAVAHLDALHGWQAFQITTLGAFEALQRSAGFGERLLQVFALASAFTNAAFIAAAGSWLLRREATERPARGVGRALWACAALNLFWMGIAGPELRAGYYLWVASFAALGSGVTMSRQDSPAR